MAGANPKVTIDRLEPELVVAPLLVRTPFKIIGSGLSNEIYIYVSTQANGGNDISNPKGSKNKIEYKIKIDKDDSAVSTDKVLSLIIKPELDAGPFDEKTIFWVAIKTKDMAGNFEDARQALKLV